MLPAQQADPNSQQTVPLICRDDVFLCTVCVDEEGFAPLDPEIIGVSEA